METKEFESQIIITMQLNKNVTELPLEFAKKSIDFEIKLLDYFNKNESSIDLKNYPLFICLEPGIVAPSFCVGKKFFSIASILGPNHKPLNLSFPSIPFFSSGKDSLQVILLNKFGEQILDVEAYVSFILTKKSIKSR